MGDRDEVLHEVHHVGRGLHVARDVALDLKCTNSNHKIVIFLTKAESDTFSLLSVQHTMRSWRSWRSGWATMMMRIVWRSVMRWWWWCHFCLSNLFCTNLSAIVSLYRWICLHKMIGMRKNGRNFLITFVFRYLIGYEYLGNYALLEK